MNLDDDEIPDSPMNEIEREIQDHIAVERDYYDSDGTKDQQISPLCLDNELSIDDQQTLEAIAKIADSDAENETTLESSESEDSDEDPDDLEILNILVEGPQLIMKMALHLVRSYEEVFPKIAGKRHLHPMEFDKIMGQLRSMF